MAISKLPTSASLKQVMDKFEEISLQDFSSIDIMTISELPNEVKEGQLVIISKYNPNSIILNSYKPSLSENDIFVELHKVEKETDIFKRFTIKTKDATVFLHVKNIIQNINGKEEKLDGYIGINNEWVALMKKELYIYNNGDKCLDVTGGFTDLSEYSCDFKFNSTHMTTTVSSNRSANLFTTNKIDLSDFSFLRFKIETDNYNGYGQVGVSTDTTVAYSEPKNVIASKVFSNIVEANGESVIDISNVNDLAHIYINVRTRSTGTTVLKVTEIKLTKE